VSCIAACGNGGGIGQEGRGLVVTKRLLTHTRGLVLITDRFCFGKL
jgi:hypothetical protein